MIAFTPGPEYPHSDFHSWQTPPFLVPGSTQNATSWTDQVQAAASALVGERNEPVGPRVDVSELGEAVREVTHPPVGMTGDAVISPLRSAPPTLPATPPGESPQAQYMNSVAHPGISSPRSQLGIGLGEQARMMGAAPQTALYQPSASFNGVCQQDSPQPPQ